jgi:hypothetical protein
MASITECDRCKKTARDDDHGSKCGWERIVWPGFEKMYRENGTDFTLCPGCYKDFKRFIKTPPTEIR